MSDEQETRVEHHSPTVYRYKGDGTEFLLGVPARDVRLEDWDLLEPDARKLLKAHAQMEDGLYESITTVKDARTALKAGGARRASAQRRRTTQVDPDPNTPGRSDSDTLNSGQAVPPTDEPQGEGAPGFQKSDIGPSNPQEG